MNDTDRDTLMGALAMRWYGWGSPVGLGLFVLFVAGATALVRFSFR